MRCLELWVVTDTHIGRQYKKLAGDIASIASGMAAAKRVGVGRYCLTDPKGRRRSFEIVSRLRPVPNPSLI